VRFAASLAALRNKKLNQFQAALEGKKIIVKCDTTWSQPKAGLQSATAFYTEDDQILDIQYLVTVRGAERQKYKVSTPFEHDERSTHYVGDPKAAEGDATGIISARLKRNKIEIVFAVKDADSTAMAEIRTNHLAAQELLDHNHTQVAWTKRFVEARKSLPGLNGRLDQLTHQLDRMLRSARYNVVLWGKLSEATLKHLAADHSLCPTALTTGKGGEHEGCNYHCPIACAAAAGRAVEEDADVEWGCGTCGAKAQKKEELASARYKKKEDIPLQDPVATLWIANEFKKISDNPDAYLHDLDNNVTEAGWNRLHRFADKNHDHYQDWRPRADVTFLSKMLGWEGFVVEWFAVERLPVGHGLLLQLRARDQESVKRLAVSRTKEAKSKRVKRQKELKAVFAAGKSDNTYVDAEEKSVDTPAAAQERKRAKKEEQARKRQEAAQKPRPFVCAEEGCNKAYITNAMLTKHLSVHNVQKLTAKSNGTSSGAGEPVPAPAPPKPAGKRVRGPAAGDEQPEPAEKRARAEPTLAPEQTGIDPCPTI
jgi:hypothetical protein